MSDYPENDANNEANWTRTVSRLLTIAGSAGLVATVLWGSVRLWQLGQARGEGGSPAAEYVTTLVLLIAGGAGSIFLWGIAVLVRRIDTIIANDSAQLASSVAIAEGVRTKEPSGGIPQHTLDELVVLLREVRDISLLSESQRTKRLDAQGHAVVAVLQREVPVLLREHNWIEARNRVQEARERFPSFPEWDVFERQIEQMRTQVEEHDVLAAERQISDLITLGAWDRVAEVVKELLQRHPDSVKAIELTQRTRASRQKVENEQISKLMTQAQEATNQRDWKAAYSMAQMIVERFPKSMDAQALKLQLPTLRENAEIQGRQRLESEIRELIRNQRYGDAVRIANDVIQQYPNSPQAEALRDQLPRIQEKALALSR